MINEVVVRIIAERIMNKGINPKTSKIFVINDIKDVEYKRAIDNYIIKHSKGLLHNGYSEKGVKTLKKLFRNKLRSINSNSTVKI
ncbi:MAG: hypothetical protein N4A50_06290 [Vallitalea sp.]|jgi:hypothetical protein|nr:hypothetical protein [Vallitalea sp.]